MLLLSETVSSIVYLKEYSFWYWKIQVTIYLLADVWLCMEINSLNLWKVSFSLSIKKKIMPTFPTFHGSYEE